jgi:hypothetical protein
MSLIKNKLIEKIIASNTIKETSILTDSTIYQKKEKVPTFIPALNIALSGSLNGGLSSGLLMIAGPSKHFKSLMMLCCAKSYLDYYPDAVFVFYDNEFGTPNHYFTSIGIDTDRVIHKPLTDIEVMKQDVAPLLHDISRGDRVFIGVDSLGNLASKKEVDDALDGKTVADMTRAKQNKSLFRIITPHLSLKDIPLVCVNHTYKTQEMYSKDVVSGGTGAIYSSNDIWIIGRQQDKDADKVIKGYDFIINIEKSRFVKEKSKIPLSVSYENGINMNSAILELAMEGDFIGQPGRSKYQLKENGEFVGDVYKADNIDELLNMVKLIPEFNDFVENKYRLLESNLVVHKDEEV